MADHPFLNQCSVAVTNTYDTTGTLTKASIKPLTPTQLKALFTDGTKWHEMSALLKTQFEMSACGTRRYGLFDWIMSSNRPNMGRLIQEVKRDRGPSLIQPFIMGRQMSVVNPDYWVVTGGYRTDAGQAGTDTVYAPSTTGPLDSVTGGDRVIRVIAGYGLDLDEKWFLPKHALYILNRGGGGEAFHGSWDVVDAALATDKTYIDVLIKDKNSFDNTLADLQPKNGVVLVGRNNVHDVEKWCHNPANYNPVKHVPFWYQYMRRSRTVDAEYRKVFKKLMEDNSWYALFQDLPMAERNRQDEQVWKKQFCNTFFFGRAISDAQRLEGTPNWSNLEQVLTLSGASVDPGTGGKMVAYKANLIGVYDQMKACSRVSDMLNQAQNIKTFCETDLYDIHRARQSQGRPANSIDIYTDSITADEWLVKFIEYAKAKLSDILRINIDEGGNELGFQWRSYRLFRPQGVVVNIITHEFFDDIVNTFTNLSTGAQTSRGKFLAVLDLGKGGSIYPAILGSNRKVYTTGQLEELAKIDNSFACVMENTTTERTLTSEICTAIVECPKNSLWKENFSALTYAV